MKIKKALLKNKTLIRLLVKEDMQYLQKKISGKSVYKNISSMYIRTPKHKKMWYVYQD